MKRIKTAILLLTVLCSFLYANAQQRTVIRGRIVDKTTKETLIGAYIVEVDEENRTVKGTTSNVSGDFVLQLKDPSHAVKVTMVGYKSQDIDPDPTKSMMIELVSSDVEIGEVKVTAQSSSSGGLTSVSERDNASSTVKVSLLDMEDTGMVSAADALQGKVSGLDIISASGDPGSGSQLVIRGLSSMGNNRPLIVIDGIPQSTVGDDLDLSSADSEDISNYINVALQDIKSIEVLKDAASTAIYGSSGADGVLLIETKKGRMGKVEFNYQYKNSLNVQPPRIPMLNGDEYIMLQLEALHNENGLFEVPRELAYDRDWEQFHNYSANTDWIGQLTQNGTTDDHFLSLSGGGDKTRFYTSFSYVDELGTTVNTRSQNFSTRVNLDYFLSRKILFQVKFNYINKNKEGNPNVNGKNVREMAYIKAPNMSILEYDENGDETGEYFNPIESYQGNGRQFFNPVAVSALGNDDKVENRLENNFMLQYRVKDWLIFRETVSFQYAAEKQNTFLPYNAIGADWLDNEKNWMAEQNKMFRSLRTETQVSFDLPFKTENHNLSGALSWITNQEGSEALYIRTSKSATANIQDPVTPAEILWISNGTYEKRKISAAANINYKFLDRYMVQANVRADALSAFGSSNRWGVFQGVSLGWRFSDEPFLELVDWLDESKLRLSWGVAGDSPDDQYARFARYGSTNNGYLTYNGIEPKTVQLSRLKWASIESLDLGLELNFFKGRLYLEGDIYQKVTTDILFPNYKIPYSSGYDKLRFFNGGEMKNTGWELMTDAKIIRTQDWLFSVNFNTSRNINAFSKLPDNYDSERSTNIGNTDFPKKVEQGRPIGTFYGFEYAGVFPRDKDALARDSDGNIMRHSDGQPIPMRYRDSYVYTGGDPQYVDQNFDGRIDLNDVVGIGDSNPDYIGGFGASLKYKDFNFSASFHYRLGFDIVNSIAMRTEGMNSRDNQSKAVLSRWRVQGDDYPNLLPRAYMQHKANNLGSSRYVERGDYLRFNNLKIAYNLDKEICRKIGLRKANIALNARKLLTFTNYTGQDPEVSQDASDPFWIGEDKARTPPPKVFTLTVGIGF